MKRMLEIEERKQAIREELQSDGLVDLTALETELRQLDEEVKGLEKRQQIAAGIGAGSIVGNPIPKPQGVVQRNFEGMERDEILSTPEYRSGYLKRLQGKDLTDVEKRVLTTGSGATAAVPTTTLNLVIDKMRQTSVLFSRVSVSYVPGNLSFTVASAKNAATWKTEGSDGTPADDTVVAVNLTGYELIKLVEISAAARAMTISAFEAYIAAELGRQLAIAAEYAILNGDGTGEPTGILPGITWNGTNSTTWPLAGAIGYDNIVDGLALLPTLYHNDAVFVMNRKTLFGGIRKIKGSDNQPIFAYNAQDKAAMTILGYPVILDDYIADDVILLGDLSYYYLNYAQAPEIESSREAGFKSGKVTYRGLAVADGKPGLAEAFVKIYKASS